jgi:S-adenosylmethionine-dependent methyltransferase
LLLQDRNFDRLYDNFRENIKESGKGRLREVLLREDLQVVLNNPPFHGKKLKVLDAGCGLGDMSLWLAQMGHEVTAIDISLKMVEHARAVAESHGLSHQIEVCQRPLQQQLEAGYKYDLICIHAVMEWLAQPYDILSLLSPCLTSSGYVSLSVYNLHRSVFASLVKGDFKRILQENFSGKKRGRMTPSHPIDPALVTEMLHEAGFTIELKAGIRCFYDHFSSQIHEEHSFEDLLLLERRYRHKAPYRDIARYVHIIARL